jgi:23S rRNA (adenine2503-C2)-methyltransferase
MKITNLKGLTLDELRDFVTALGEKSFRATQLFAWIYRRNGVAFDEMTDISRPFRARLAESATIGALTGVNSITSPNADAQKFLFQLPDGNHVESVLISEDKRQTVCLSSQVGCALGCKFCATATLGFTRNLAVWEILDQFLAIQRLTRVEITNVVIMGMGEPLLNYENVIKACQLLNHPDGPAVGHRKIVISTCGIVPAIIRFADERQPFKLAISLNAPTNTQRNEIMPINKKYPLEQLMDAARYYARKSRLRVTFEYVLLNDFNDRPQDAVELKKLLSGIPCKINLIPYNEIGQDARRPANERIDRFYRHFLDYPAVVSVRWSKGVDIEAACGQLAARNQHRANVDTNGKNL